GGRRSGEEDPRLLEGLADGGDPEPDPARVQAELHARGRVVRPTAAVEQVGRPVAGVDGAAGKDVGAAHELGGECASEHEDLERGGVTDEHHGGGLSRGHHRDAPESGSAEDPHTSRTTPPVYVATCVFPAGVSRAPSYAGGVDPRRALPGVDQVLSALSGLPHELLVACAREAIEAAREQISHEGEAGEAAPFEDVVADARRRVQRLRGGLLRPVVNATGVIVHTNLGRTPVGEDALAAARAVGGSYSNLEYRMDEGRRGSRHENAGSLLARACGAEAGLVVNNHAAAVLLSLAALARGREVLVSRGELVEIGGGFRVPEIMAESGSRLVEVGTTNRTRRSDYAAAVTDRTALVLKVHASNYRMVGFVESTPVADLARLGPPVMVDAGSGLLDDTTPWLPRRPAWLRDEPGVRQAIDASAALVTFSGGRRRGGPRGRARVAGGGAGGRRRAGPGGGGPGEPPSPPPPAPRPPPSPISLAIPPSPRSGACPPPPSPGWGPGPGPSPRSPPP